jgi:hypothetical protein
VGDYWSKYMITTIPIIAYPVLYVHIRHHYLTVLNKNKDFITVQEERDVYRALRQTLFFFLAII